MVIQQEETRFATVLVFSMQMLSVMSGNSLKSSPLEPKFLDTLHAVLESTVIKKPQQERVLVNLSD